MSPTAVPPTLVARLASRLYVTATTHQLRPVRTTCMALVFLLLWTRVLKLYRRDLAAAAAALAAGCWYIGLWVIPAAAAAGMAMLCWEAANLPTHVAGHRAGAEGYAGPYFENTIQALQQLLERDYGPNGPVPDMHYVEIDVQETADGEVVVFHDFHLRHAFPVKGPNEDPWRELQQQGLDPATATIQDLTLKQLQTLHLGAAPGVHVPTLEAFIDACMDGGLRWCLVVEVKRLVTDKGRARLVEQLRSYAGYADTLEQMWVGQQKRLRQLRREAAVATGGAAFHARFAVLKAETDPVRDSRIRLHPLLQRGVPVYGHPQLGLLAVIAFPVYYVASFGQLGSREERRWTQQLVDIGIEPRCCFVWGLKYSHGLRTGG